jgi:hypothetical protein
VSQQNVCSLDVTKKTRKLLIELTFSFPCGFFSVMVPLNFIHFNHRPPGTSFLLVKDFGVLLNIREDCFHHDFLLFNNFGRNSDTFL